MKITKNITIMLLEDISHNELIEYFLFDLLMKMNILDEIKITVANWELDDIRVKETVVELKVEGSLNGLDEEIFNEVTLKIQSKKLKVLSIE